jgi:hypothetical protein
MKKDGIIQQPETLQPIKVATEQELKERMRQQGIIPLPTFSKMAEDGKDLIPLRKIFGNYILENNTVLFPSERGLGKTWLGIQLAEAISNETPTFLGEEIEVHGNVIYFNLEMSQEVLMRRLVTLRKNPPFELRGRFHTYCYSGRGNFHEIIYGLEDLIKMAKPVLIIVDNLRTAFKKADNERNSQMTNMLTTLNNFRDKHQCAFLLLHHTVKGAHKAKEVHSDMQSGAGAITDLVDADFLMVRDRSEVNRRFLKREKSRHVEETHLGKIIGLNGNTNWFEVVQEDVSQTEHYMRSNAAPKDKKLLAVKLRSEGRSLEEIGKQLDVHKSTAHRWLEDEDFSPFVTIA